MPFSISYFCFVVYFFQIFQKLFCFLLVCVCLESFSPRFLWRLYQALMVKHVSWMPQKENSCFPNQCVSLCLLSGNWRFTIIIEHCLIIPNTVVSVYWNLCPKISISPQVCYIEWVFIVVEVCVGMCRLFCCHSKSN